MASRSFTRIMLAGALAIAPACDDPLSPIALAGTYELRRVGTTELPVKLHELMGSSNWLIADTLVLRADRSGERRRTVESRNVDADSERSSYIQDLQFSAGDRIEIYFACPPEEICALILRPIIAHRTREGLLLTEQLGDGESLEYVRVR